MAEALSCHAFLGRLPDVLEALTRRVTARLASGLPKEALLAVAAEASSFEASSFEASPASASPGGVAGGASLGSSRTATSESDALTALAAYGGGKTDENVLAVLSASPFHTRLAEWMLKFLRAAETALREAFLIDRVGLSLPRCCQQLLPSHRKGRWGGGLIHAWQCERCRLRQVMEAEDLSPFEVPLKTWLRGNSGLDLCVSTVVQDAVASQLRSLSRAFPCQPTTEKTTGNQEALSAKTPEQQQQQRIAERAGRLLVDCVPLIQILLEAFFSRWQQAEASGASMPPLCEFL